MIMTSPPARSVFFVQQAPLDGERESLATLLVGQLVFVDACLPMRVSGTAGKYLVIWPLEVRCTANMAGLRSATDTDGTLHAMAIRCAWEAGRGKHSGTSGSRYADGRRMGVRARISSPSTPTGRQK